MTENTIRLGTRGSALARWQTNHVRDLLQQAWPGLRFEIQVITTKGDKILDTPLPLVGGKGLFTAELEHALRTGAIDFAVHSLKDLPTDAPDGLVMGAILTRANPADVLVSRDNHTLANLPQGATIGTSSRRRAAQLLYQHPDLNIADIRGNVETRIRKVMDVDGPYNATLLAYAGLHRLEKLEFATEVLAFEKMLPAPGQGALAVQCRDETQSLAWLSLINDPQTHAAVAAERAFLTGLGGGCSVPIAAYATWEHDTLHLHGRVTAVDGNRQIDVTNTLSLDVTTAYHPTQVHRLGAELAEVALEQGAAALLEKDSEG